MFRASAGTRLETATPTSVASPTNSPPTTASGNPPSTSLQLPTPATGSPTSKQDDRYPWLDHVSDHTTSTWQQAGGPPWRGGVLDFSERLTGITERRTLYPPGARSGGAG